MRILRQGKSAASVRAWQQFLTAQGCYSGAITRQFDQATLEATQVFQRQAELGDDGVVGPVTIAAAKERGFQPPSEYFEIGPDREGSLRESRPYFLVPMDREDLRNEAVARILEWVRALPRPVTDLYVLSHGWHRNFFDAISAYDRLVSRFSVLLHRGRIQPPQEFHPLFVTLHWHSDPGVEDWFDKSGRRHKESFLRLCREKFEPGTVTAGQPPPQMTNDFEDLFEFFSRMVAPGVEALGNWDLYRLDQQRRLKDKLALYNLQDAPAASVDEKVSVVWTCYHEAERKRVLVDQAEKPDRFLGFWPAVRNVAAFAGGAAGILVLVRLLWGLFGKPLMAGLAWLARQLSGVYEFIREAPVYFEVCYWLLLYSAVAVLAWGYLSAQSASRPASESERQKRGGSAPPVCGILAWFWLQLPPALLAILYLTLSYFLGWALRGKYLFAERSDGPAGHAMPPRPTIAERLAALAIKPMDLLKASVATDSAVGGMVDAIKNQFAFFEMQRKAVETGANAAGVLGQLRSDLADAGCANLDAARLHLIGHSFGGLVIANAARELDAQTRQRLHSLCLVQGALASSWFERDAAAFSTVGGAVGCVYSRYDTANGFYYPFANQGRMAAGFVGLFGEPGVERLGGKGEFASLTKPPQIARPNRIPPLLNLDASRIVYEGPAAAGGGHGDIFKDDVVNLIWAVTSL